MIISEFKTLVVLLVTLTPILALPRRLNPICSKIIGGIEASRGEFPSLVSVQGFQFNLNQFAHICGGTIIDNNHIVTVAHCVTYFTAEYLRVVAGAHNIAISETAYQQIRAVKRIQAHQDYNALLFRNDIAILQVFPGFDETRWVRSVQMPPNDIEPKGICEIAGWGWTSDSGPMSNVLLKAEVPLMTQTECRTAYPNDFHNDTQICAGLKQGGIDACVGDTGGPLICNDSGYKYIAGISSYGYLCAQPEKPGVYTDVSKYIQWIQEARQNWFLADITDSNTTGR